MKYDEQHKKFLAESLANMINPLLAALPNEVRAVTVDVNTSPEKITFFFYCDGIISEDCTEECSCIDTQFTSTMGDYEYEWDVKRLDFPQPIPLQGCFAFLRHEDRDMTHEIAYNKAAWPEIGKFFTGNAAFAAQLALLGAVTPNLRGVAVNVINDPNILQMFFYYEGQLDVSTELLWRQVMEETKTSLCEPLNIDCELQGLLERIDKPRNIKGLWPKGAWLIYCRNEYWPPMKLLAPGFTDDTILGPEYRGDGDNLSPALRIENIPYNAQSLLLIMHTWRLPSQNDATKEAIHWLIFNIPTTTTYIAKGEIPKGGVVGMNSKNTLGYFGPTHEDLRRCQVWLHAIDRILPLSEGASMEDIKRIHAETKYSTISSAAVSILLDKEMY
jgi:phosphatidylethanolamine-binding protein (PEBP) family uncharacterized protein